MKITSVIFIHHLSPLDIYIDIPSMFAINTWHNIMVVFQGWD